ncbi:Bacterial mobilisation protein (MobC) [Campylobacter hyointestinalis subsp. hyointestinalis]|uniref:Bacterial mobilisation protein (MobC) n=1 Tax=Campylobacter hyointestinalis subsp. hyointestinalis TaxID=91352 RepID=A0A0S4SPI3_CAMHY|nr:hypothetical protein [Campylobacter hyointestinalis]CUU72697.1 Bacterial mobilisation protein (MobC) [Campylobacter hyointestinalis subsp. hyointestinalis]CUU72698.1 Bacterial mobilisation protein (MobC) [Campylobacter hyointestinalis subsp. hyointestinalis]CUU84391.1 Bacterial mobilisation protein (MobC) [Campylobacter hyointestinalis subsp. hyointestinalis]CUU87722.1 Bacterial mobilisation protein (MobC) [Campylobacter hyointestinalis subsp. hyointestinalis]
MRKNERHSIYLTLTDLKKINQLSKQRNESKSAIVRKLIHIEKYAQTLKQIEIGNDIMAGFLKELNRLGKNLNQIAYHLNAHIIKKEEAKSDLENNMYLFREEIKKVYERISDLEIKTGVERTKTPAKQQKKGKR